MAKILNLFKNEKETLEKRLNRISNGDREEREKLILEYTPFIIKTITEVINRYIETENDDEYSIGLQAFDEAITKYNPNKGKFLSFAKLLIRNRIIDFLRKETSSKTFVHINAGNDFEEAHFTSDKEYDFVESFSFRQELLEFQKKLKDFDILLDDLVEGSPKHKDTRLNAIRIARHIVEDKEILQALYMKKAMPVQKVISRIDTSNKVLKRNRKFIIATALILDSKSEFLKSYVCEVERREINDL